MVLPPYTCSETTTLRHFLQNRQTCIDPTHINPLIKDITFALPVIPTYFANMRDGDIYSLIDIDGEFNSLLMDEDTQDIYTFEFKGIRFSFVSCPFGIKTIPA